MEYYVTGLYILCGVIALLSLYTKIRHKKAMKKMDDDIKKRMEYHKRPMPATFTDEEVRKMK